MNVPRVLLVDQGQASARGVQGHLRAAAATESGVRRDGRLAVETARLPGWTAAERVAKKRLPRLGAADFGPARWQLLRSGATARLVQARLERDPAVDAVHVTTHAVGLRLAAVAAQLPVVLSVDVPLWEWQRLLRGLPPGAPPALDMLPVLARERRALAGAAAVQAWTATVAAQLRGVAPTARVVTVHPGLDLELFRPAPGPRRSGPRRVLFVGGNFVRKGGERVLDALGPVLGRGVVLDIVTGEEVVVPPGVDPAGVVVRRLGPGPELAELFRHADLLCLPSHADAVPWVVLEALASGTPAVVSGVGSLPELVGQPVDSEGPAPEQPQPAPAGAVVAAGDATGLRHALMDLLDDPGRLRAAGQAGRARCETLYDAARNGAVLADTLVDVAAPGARPRRRSGGPAGPTATVPRRIYVCGNSRSGTTLVARLLGNSPALRTLPELHFYEQLWRPDAPDDRLLDEDEALALADRLLHCVHASYLLPQRVGEHAAEAAAVLTGRHPLHAEQVFLAVVDHVAEVAGASGAVEQTPRNVYYLREILRRQPDARAVVVVRDPRDVLLSQKNWWRRGRRGSTVSWRTTLRRRVDYHPVTTSLLWRSGVRAGDAAAADPLVGDRVRIIRFEDLVADPAPVVADLLAELGLQPVPGQLDVAQISSSNADDRRDGRGVDPAVVGRFRSGLTPAEVWLCERLTRMERARHGYSTAAGPTLPILPTVAATLVVLPVQLTLAVGANARRARHLLAAARRRMSGPDRSTSYPQDREDEACTLP